MPGVPAYCPACDYAFEGRGIVVEGEVRNLTVSGSTETCPICRGPARIAEGTFDVRNGVFEVLFTVGQDRELWQRLAPIAQQAQDGAIPPEEAALRIADESPELASFLERVPPKARAAVIWVLLWALATLGSQAVAEWRDDSATHADVERVVERSFEHHDAAQEEILRRVVDEAVANYYRRHPSAEGAPSTRRSSTPKPGRNDPCPCGSGKKYKRCCGQ